MKYAALFLASALFLGGCGAPGEPSAPSGPPQVVPMAEEAAPVPTKAEPPVIPEASAALSRDALAAYGAGDAARALALTGEALGQSDKNYEALALRGLLIAFDGSPDEGAALVRQALALYPDYVQGSYDLAMALKLGGHYEESIGAFRKVLEADPQNVWSLYGIATNYSDMRDREQALFWLKQAVALAPAEVKPEAAVQDHFQWLHGDAEFDALVR